MSGARLCSPSLASWPRTAGSTSSLGGESAIAALADRAFAAVDTLGSPASCVLDGTAHMQSMSVFVPGLLTWSDISLTAALSHSPVTLQAPVGSSGQARDAVACAALAAETRDLAGRLDRQAGRRIRP